MDDQQTREAAADLIDGAIDVLHERGWCQGTLVNDAGNRCVLGALRVAADATNHALLKPSVAAVSHALDLDGSASHLVLFNNDPLTSAEDVLLGMKRAAASLREVTS